MYHFVVVVSLLVFLPSTVLSQCQVNIATDGTYSFSASNDGSWLSNGPFAFQSGGAWKSTQDGSLKLKPGAEVTSGRDEIGNYSDTKWILETDDQKVMTASIRNYNHNDSIFMFIQEFPKGLSGTARELNQTMSMFPSIKLEAPTDTGVGPLGYLSFGSFMFGDRTKKAGVFDDKAKFNDGLDGSGPVAFFDKKGNALVMSPYTNFMAASMWQQDNAPVLGWGIMGGVDDIPIRFQHKTIVYCSNNGIGHAFEGWGEVMKSVYNKTKNVTDFHQGQDISLTHLGYWTDNGAYYYYNPEQGKNYEETLLDVKKHAQDDNIPYKYMQLDSWFYPKDEVKAVTTWHSTEDIFPNGIEGLQRKLNMPLVAHNRYWSVNTTYAKENGGLFDFFIGSNESLPNSKIFWEFLLGHAREEWGLAVYEQDWLNVQLLWTEALTNNLHNGRKWLMQMGEAAQTHQVKIQYCMALPRQALQSLEIQAVTQGRVSNDYMLLSDQWKIGVTSHFAHAMGVAPSKDTFWTTSDQPGSTHKLTEPYPTLQGVVATLSTGPVGPGDRIGATNRTALMRCCNADGLILKPSKPARAIDDQILEMAYKDGSGAPGEVWTTYSSHEGLLYGVILAANLSADYSINAQRAGFLSPLAPKFSPGVLFRGENPTSSVTPFDNTTEFTIKKDECVTDGEPFCLFYFSPNITYNSHTLNLLGDLDKWVPMSELRVLRIWYTTSGMTATVRGAHGETIRFSIMVDGSLVTLDLTSNKHGCANFPVAVKLDEDLNWGLEREDVGDTAKPTTTPRTTTRTTKRSTKTTPKSTTKTTKTSPKTTKTTKTTPKTTPPKTTKTTNTTPKTTKTTTQKTTKTTTPKTTKTTTPKTTKTTKTTPKTTKTTKSTPKTTKTTKTTKITKTTKTTAKTTLIPIIPVTVPVNYDCRFKPPGGPTPSPPTPPQTTPKGGGGADRLGGVFSLLGVVSTCLTVFLIGRSSLL